MSARNKPARKGPAQAPARPAGTAGKPAPAKKPAKRPSPKKPAGRKAAARGAAVERVRAGNESAPKKGGAREVPAKRPSAKKVAAKKPAARKVAAKKPAAWKVAAKKPAPPKRGPAARKKALRAPGNRTTEERVTPLVNEAPVSPMPFVEGFRPSRILTTRPRPVIRQVDPTGGIDEGPRTLQPWEIEVDDLAELMAARAAEEKAAEEEQARYVATPKSAQSRIDQARKAGWTEDKRPAQAGLADTRVRLVHPSCKFIDGKAVRDVSLSVHPPTGRATLLVEGGPRLRSASFRMREDEDLPAQISKLLEDPARLARTEHASSQDLLAELDAVDRTAVVDLRALVGRGQSALTARLRKWVADFAGAHSAFGLPATVDAAWDRFGVRRGCVLERIGVPDDARHTVADAFDAALDSA